MSNIRAFLRHACEEAVWAAWLYFHPFTHLKLAGRSTEYRDKRSEVIQRLVRR